MNSFLKTCFSRDLGRRRKSQLGRRGSHLFAGVALSIALFVAFPLFGQNTPGQKLTEAYRLEREGKPAPAIIALKSLLDSKSLDRAGIGKAWNVLGLASEDQGDFSASRHAFEQSIQAYKDLPDETRDYAMALDDFGELYVVTGQLDPAERMMKRALDLYGEVQDHAGLARSFSDLAGAFFTQKKIREGRKNLDHALKESQLTHALDDDDLATLASLRGWLAQCDGDLPASALRYQQSLDLLRKSHGEEHASTGWGYVLLGQISAETGDLDGSLADMVRGLAILDRALNSQDPRLLSAEIAYSRVLDKVGRHSEAASIRANSELQLSAFRNSQCVDCTVSAEAFR